jgi:type III secretion apparatus needle protein
MAGDTSSLVGVLSTTSQPFSPETPYVNRDGFDQILLQSPLQTQMASVENDIRSIENNANLSDTEKMFSMQMAMNTWTAISTLRTSMLKSVGDVLKGTVQNIGT